MRGKFSGGSECFGAGVWGGVWRRMHKHEKECNWVIRVKGMWNTAFGKLVQGCLFCRSDI